MAASLGSVTLKLHLSTETGGPIELGQADIEVPVTTTGDHRAGEVALTIDQDVLRHEIANALIGVARALERGE